MTLRERLLDAVIDGHLGHGLIITRQELIAHFHADPETYTGVLLSNSEMITGHHSPTYEHFTLRVDEGRYRIHPLVLSQRMQERGLLS
jgi:hypothetical protein